MKRYKLTKYGVKLRYVPEKSINGGIKIQIAFTNECSDNIALTDIMEGQTYYKAGNIKIVKVLKVRK